MKSIILLLALMLLGSCNQSVKDKQAKAVVFKDTISNTYDSVFKVNTIPLRVKIFRERERIYSLQMPDGSVIIEPADYYANIEISDINKDGFDDMRIFVISNTPNQCQNYFFDPKNKKFRIIQNSDLDIRLVPNTNLYYSNNKAGCADMNWESHLSKIENFKEIKIGLILTHDCDDDNDGISFYKIDNERKQVLINKLPDPNFEIEGKKKKQDFIEKYWINNYKKYQ